MTAGYKLPKEKAYPGLLEKLLQDEPVEASVLNAGVSGDTSAQALRRIPWVMKKGPFDWVILCIGANDGLRSMPLGELEKNLVQIVRKFKDSKTKVLMFGMKLPVNLNRDYRMKFEKVYEKVAKEEGVFFHPFLLEGVAGVSELQLDDQIHPNEQGHVEVSKHVKEVFLKFLRK